MLVAQREVRSDSNGTVPSRQGSATSIDWFHVRTGRVVNRIGSGVCLVVERARYNSGCDEDRAV